MAQYPSTSPYQLTRIGRNSLEYYIHIPIVGEDNDINYVIQPQYNFRPDLLAYDLYQNSKLWWVFTNRNMEVLKDPIFDFIAGTEIKLPKKSYLDRLLGA